MHSHENESTCIPKSTNCARRSDWYSDQRLWDSFFRPFLQRYEIHRSKWWGKTENASSRNPSITFVSQQQVAFSRTALLHSWPWTFPNFFEAMLTMTRKKLQGWSVWLPGATANIQEATCFHRLISLSAFCFWEPFWAAFPQKHWARALTSQNRCSIGKHHFIAKSHSVCW